VLGVACVIFGLNTKEPQIKFGLPHARGMRHPYILEAQEKPLIIIAINNSLFYSESEVRIGNTQKYSQRTAPYHIPPEQCTNR